jgi:hypothetical protein
VSTTPDPAAAILERLRDEQDVCGSDPPAEGTAEGSWGDCYCTLAPRHGGGVCFCEICTVRHGAPGWPTPKEDE